MKYLYSFLLFICFCPVLYGQITFEKILYNSRELAIEGKDICVNSSDEILTLVSTAKGSSVYKLSSVGDTIWMKKLTHPDGNIQANRICNGVDGGYIIAGNLKIDTFSEIYLTKIDETGNKLWEKRFGDSETYNYCYDLIEILEEGYLLCGSMSTPTTKAALIKCDSKGDLIWQNNDIIIDGIADPNSFMPRSVSNSSEGYFIGGEYYNNSTPNSAIVKFDVEGNQLLSSKIEGTQRAFISAITSSKDDAILFVGKKEYENSSKIWFGKYAFDGSLIYEREIENSNHNDGNDILEDLEGNTILGGTRYTENYMEDPYLAKFSSTGELIWEKVYGSTLGGHLSKIFFKGNYFYGIGYHWVDSGWGVNQNDNMVFVLKTDINGDVNHVRITNPSNNFCSGIDTEIKVYDFMKSYAWETIENVDKSVYSIIARNAGKYSARVVDRNDNARTSDTLILLSGPNPQITYTEDSKFCGDGDKTVTTKNEFNSYEWFITDENLNLVSIGNSRNHIVSKDGQYRVQVVDENSCKNEIKHNDDQFVNAYESKELVAFVADSSNISRGGLEDGFAKIGVEGGNPPYSFLWEESGSTSSTMSNLKANHYYHVTVFDDKACQTQVTFVLKVMAVIENDLCNFSKVGGDIPLFNSNIYTIERDVEGKLWFANPQEIGMYDGKKWKTIDAGKTFETIHKDKKGNLWGGNDFNNLGLNKFDGLKWISFDKEDGLPGYNIRDIAEDSYGNLWLATDQGLSRYDGYQFTNFGTEDGLLDLDLYSLHIDKKDQIWIGSNNGITKYEILTKTKIDSCVTYSYAGSKSFGGIKNIAEDMDGNIWISSSWVSDGESGLLKFENENFKFVQTSLSNPITWITDIYADSKGGVWIATDKGAVYFDSTNWYEYSTNDGLITNAVSSIGEDLLGNIWLGYNPGEGLNKYSNGGWITYNNASELLQNGIKKMTLDTEQNLWVSLDQGSYVLQKYDGTAWYKFSEDDGFVGYVYDMASDSKGNVWIATDIALYKYSQSKFEKITINDGLKSDRVLGVTVDKNDNVWLRFDDGKGINKYANNQFIYYTKNDGLLDDRIRSIQADSLGSIWISYDGDFNKKISKYNGSSFSSIDAPIYPNGTQYPVNRIFVDSQNRTWTIYEERIAFWHNNEWVLFGEADHGISREFSISTIGEDAANNVIFSFYKEVSEGIIEIKQVQYTGNSWVNINSNNGLPESYVQCVEDDYKGNLWYGTAKGLLRFTKCTNEEVIITVDNGNCAGDGNRSLILTPTWGNYPYQYSNNGGDSFQSDSIFKDLQADTYYLKIKNKNGEQVIEKEITITEPIPLVVNIEGINVTCFGRTDGIAICEPSGGLEPYTFLWDNENASTTQKIENLLADIEYSVTVSDANGCTSVGTVILGHDPLLKITDWKDVSCFGLSDGVATITPLRGKAPFQYQWDDSENTTDSIVTTLSSNKYHYVTVTDGNNCVSIDSIMLVEPDEIVLNINSFNSCSGDNSGGAELSVSGGIIPYTYQWDDSNQSKNKNLYDLAAGTYSVTLSDYSGCEKTQNIVIEQYGEAQSVSIVSNKDQYYCPETTELTSDNEFSSYLWSTGEKDQTIVPAKPGKYWVRGYDENLCSATDTITIAALSTYQEQNVCLVTVSADNKNEIVWERRNGYGIASYNVYKESNSASKYELISNIPFEDKSVITDEDSDPSSRSHTYAVSVVDMCDVESEVSEAHRTMLLQASYGINGAVNLAWNKYLGLDFDTYYIYRGTKLDQMELLTSISNSESKYIDNNAPEEEYLYYLLQIEAPDVCEPNNLKSSLTDYGISHSNIIDAGLKPTGINIKNDYVEEILLYPNPMTINCIAEFNNSNFSEYQMFIYDSNGKLVLAESGINTSQVEIKRGNLASGQYIVEFRGDKIYRGRLIIK